MNGASVLFRGGRPADDGAQCDDRGPRRLRQGRFECPVQSMDIFFIAVIFVRPVHPFRVPAIGAIPGQHVLRKSHICVVFNGNVVVVPQHNEISEFLVPGKRRGFCGDAFLKVSVRCDHKDSMIEWGFTGRGIRVQQTSFSPCRHSHTHSVADPLTEWASRGFDTGGVPKFRVSRSGRTIRSERSNILNFKAISARE